MYFPLMAVCQEIANTNKFADPPVKGGLDNMDTFGARPRIYIGFVLLAMAYASCLKLRKRLAELDDSVLSNHLQVVVMSGGITAVVPIAYVSMKGTNCIAQQLTEEDVVDQCTGEVSSSA